MQATGDPRGYYDILGVGRGASFDDVRQAFRKRAMLLHPDRAGKAADHDRFRLLCEAYEVLRDPRRRMQYDAEALQAEGSSRSKSARGRSFGGIWPLVSLCLAVLLIGMLASLWSAWQGMNERDERLADLRERLSAAMRDQADVRARYRSANFLKLESALNGLDADVRGGSGYVFHAELAFEPDEIDLNSALRSQLNLAVIELAEVVSAIPKGRDWVILIEGLADEAAVADGVAVSAWETALLRLGGVVDYLVEHDMPAKRLAVRFQAGFGIGEEADDSAGTVEIKLLCCFY